jgi:magnesium-dependent phosphatase-1
MNEGPVCSIIEHPESLAIIGIDETTKLLVLDVDGTIWPNEYNPDRQPPFVRLSANEVRTGGGETISINPGMMVLLHRALNRNIICSIASIGDPDVVLPIIQQFRLPIRFKHPQLGWDGKDAMIEEILRRLEAEDGTKVSDAEILFLDDEEKNLIEVGNRFPAARLVKAP